MGKYKQCILVSNFNSNCWHTLIIKLGTDSYYLIGERLVVKSDESQTISNAELTLPPPTPTATGHRQLEPCQGLKGFRINQRESSIVP